MSEDQQSIQPLDVGKSIKPQTIFVLELIFFVTENSVKKFKDTSLRKFSKTEGNNKIRNRLERTTINICKHDNYVTKIYEFYKNNVVVFVILK